MSADDARRFRTGRRCLDFAHTGGDGPFAAFELLHTHDDVARWLAVVIDVEVRAGGVPLADVIALRRAIWNGAHQLIAGHPLAPPDRDAINAAARHPPVVPALGHDGRATAEEPASVRAALSTLARDAVDLFGGPSAHRVRECAAHDCSLIFVDDSRPGQRQWCSMQRCGNLAKVRAHRRRNNDSEKLD